ncbi:MAG: glycosyltransferase [Oscillospiraceae bacterium]|nr:glycosyltransferase [Oscillospiraceae bacterium]
MKKVSVIIPLYNAAEYLPAMAESLLSQDYENLQIIFSTDGSTDSTPELLHAIAARDSRVVLVEGENTGVSSARNRALALADGDYVGFADGDDLLEPGYFSTLVSLLEETGADAAVCGFHRLYVASGVSDRLPPRDSDPFVTDREGFLRQLLIPEGYACVIWNKLFRREALLTKDGTLQQFDTRIHICEDGEYLFRSNVRKAVFTSAPLYRYFVRSSGAMYGPVTERKLTEPLARRLIVEHTASCGEELQQLAKMKYQKAIRDLMFHGVITGQYSQVKGLMPELKQWRQALYASPALSKKEKLKYRVYYWIIRLNLRRTGAFLMKKLSGH